MVEKLKIGSIVIRCFEFDKMLAFWKEALHYVHTEPVEGGWVILRDPEGSGPNVSLDQTSIRRSGKRSRLHFDLYTTDQEARSGGSSRSARPDTHGDTAPTMTSLFWRTRMAISFVWSKSRSRVNALLKETVPVSISGAGVNPTYRSGLLRRFSVTWRCSN